MDLLTDDYRRTFESGDIETIEEAISHWTFKSDLELFRALRNAAENDYGQTKSIGEYLRRLFFAGEAIIESESLPEVLGIFGSSCKSLSFQSDSSEIDFSLIESLVSLEELKLTLPSCKSISGNWSNLQKLRRIEIYGPEILHIPDIDFQKITDFKLSHTSIESLPNHFWVSKSLLSIGLHQNLVLTTDIDPHWPSLEEFSLSGNRNLSTSTLLKASPNTEKIIIGSDYSENIVFPEIEFLNLTYLEIFSSKGVKSLEVNFESIPRLSVLKCTHTGIRDIPNSICQCRELTCLDFYSSPIQTIPDCIGNLLDLEELNLGNTELTTFPMSLAKLGKLAVLNLPKSFNPKYLEEDDVKKNLLSSLKGEIPQCFFSFV